MNFDEEITITQGKKQIKLPLRNFLRLTMVYLQKILPEYYEDPEHKSNSIDEFIKWIYNKLGVEPGEGILL